MRCGWSGSIEQFLRVEYGEWVAALRAHHAECSGEGASASQTEAWSNCFRVLNDSLPRLVRERPAAGRWGIAFECQLPRERGRRPDVVLLAAGAIIVLEFKDFRDTLQAHIDQVAAYARDLGNYHSASHDHRIEPVLVNTLSSGVREQSNGVAVVSPDTLAPTLLNLTDGASSPIAAMTEWLTGTYAPLPALVRAARMIFDHEPLPHIRRAQSAGVNDAVAEVTRIAHHARQAKERHLVLVTGVPGAGKTLVGLQCAYGLRVGDDRPKALFLSGNKPLVAVLQYALSGKGRKLSTDPARVFVRDVLGFVKEHMHPSSPLPPEHVWIYDEAQRAWDRDLMAQRHGIDRSEPDVFLALGQRMPHWAVMVGLIGSGQEIYKGEEAGLEQWNDAIANTGGEWIVHCPDAAPDGVQLSTLFTAAREVVVNPVLSLDSSLRSHLAQDLPEWVRCVLMGDRVGAASLARQIREAAFPLYITQNVELAKDYTRRRYDGHVDARYALLASNKDTILPEFGVRNDFQYQRHVATRIGKFFVDAPGERYSCCNLADVATAFECQGLEVEFPIVCWGDDLVWNGRNWQTRRTNGRSTERDPYKLRINNYRVLLSRGRDGMIIFVPDHPKVQQTYAYLKECGTVDLPAADSATGQAKATAR